MTRIVNLAMKNAVSGLVPGTAVKGLIVQCVL